MGSLRKPTWGLGQMDAAEVTLSTQRTGTLTQEQGASGEFPGERPPVSAPWWRAFRGHDPQGQDELEDFGKAALIVLVAMWLGWTAVVVVTTTLLLSST